MAITNNARKYLDFPMWRQLAPHPSIAFAPVSGASNAIFTCDLRSRDYADPLIYAHCNTNSQFATYNPVTNGWEPRAFSASLGGTHTGGGLGWVFVPSQGPSGTIASGATTRSFTLTTALPAAVNLNALANRGDGKGYIIRIIGNSAGGSGKIEERRIIGNTAGSTPTITVDAPFTFTPASGDRYELLSGAIFVLSTGASKAFSRHDIATSTTTAALSTTNLMATVGASFNDLLPLDEQYVPYDRYPGEGFVVDGSTVYDNTSGYVKKCLTATVAAAGSITGQATGGDSSLAAHQYRNFQIRIVEDTSTPTAVGQRRRITGHTAGPSVVYTLASNWTVTPSNTAKFVIENDNDKLLFTSGSGTTVYNYNHAANSWDTTTWAVRGATPGSGTGTFQLFGINDPTNNARHSLIYSLRCTGTGGNPVDVLDIAGGTNGTWSSFSMTSSNFSTNLVPVSSNGAIYDPFTNNGRYLYFLGPTSTQAGPLNIFRLDVLNRTLEGFTPVPTTLGPNSDNVGSKLSLKLIEDGATRLSVLFCRRPAATAGDMFSCPILM